VLGTGVFDITTDATLEFTSTSTLGSGQTIQMAPSESVKFNQSVVSVTSDVQATIEGFALGDYIALVNIAGASNAVIDGSNVLHVQNGATDLATLQLDATNAGEHFVVKSDGVSGSLITIDSPPQVTIATEILASDTGSSNTDFITEDAHRFWLHTSI